MLNSKLFLYLKKSLKNSQTQLKVVIQRQQHKSFQQHILKIVLTSLGFMLSHPVWAVSTIQSPENMVVLSMNQQAVKNGFLKNKKQYQLESGPAELSVRYQQYFDHGNTQHDILKSDEIVIQIPHLQDQQQYRLALVQAPQDFEAAKKYVEHPVIALYDQNHQQIEIQQRNTQRSRSILSGWLGQEQKTTYNSPKATSYPSTQPVSKTAKSSQRLETSTVKSYQNGHAQLSNDQLMMQLWQKASKVERQKFMSWLVDHE